MSGDVLVDDLDLEAGAVAPGKCANGCDEPRHDRTRLCLDCYCIALDHVRQELQERPKPTRIVKPRPKPPAPPRRAAAAIQPAETERRPNQPERMAAPLAELVHERGGVSSVAEAAEALKVQPHVVKRAARVAKERGWLVGRTGHGGYQPGPSRPD